MQTHDGPAGLKGLTEQEAQAVLSAEGHNELPSAKRRTICHIALDVVREPMFLLLLACGIVYLFAGEREEALMLLGFVAVVMGITFYQERKTERALEALRDLSSPRASVIRDGERKRIAGRDVVRGDILLLSEGDRVPADAEVVWCTNLSVDESLLTGESVPVRKAVRSVASDATHPGGDDLPYVYSGSLVVQGQGAAIVRATGMRTEIGKIGKSLQVLATENTPLQKQTGRIVRTFATVGAVLCMVVVVVYGLTRGNWLQGFLAGLSLAMAMLPEEFPVVLTIFLALGAWRISRHRVLTRHVPAVETLGSATALCVDKTGTLTMNRMTVSDLCVNGEFVETGPGMVALPGEYHELVEYSILASPVDPFDPMEKAMKDLGRRFLDDTGSLHPDWKLQREYPLSRDMLAMTRVWEEPGEHGRVVAVKGAPEAVAALCHLSDEQVRQMSEWVDQLSGRGRRVIAVAAGRHGGSGLPGQQHGFDFRFLGLLGLEDPVRPGVAEAISECYAAGVRTIMITGDYPGTARNIALQLGLRNAGAFVTGAQLQTMSDDELAERIKTVNIFARMVPEQKLRLVQALKHNGEVVAMTGDGVNDAPALKAAHIGIAMGGRGTDVAREAGSIVLLDDDFGSIVKAVSMGRRIYDNLRKAMMFIFSVHIPIAGLSLIPVLFRWPLALLPVHIVFLELIIDPVCSIVFEAEKAEANVMNRPPRRLSDSLFGQRSVLLGLLQGLLILGVVATIYAWALGDHGEGAARALAFSTLVVCNMGLILANRSNSRSLFSSLLVPNPALWWVMGASAVLLGCTLLIPAVNGLFRFGAFGWLDFGICVGGGLVTFALLEMLKAVGARWAAAPSTPMEKTIRA